MEKEEIMERIQAIKKLSGLSNAALAKKYQIPIRTLEDWLSGKRTPPEYLVYMWERCVNEDYGKDTNSDREI